MTEPGEETNGPIFEKTQEAIADEMQGMNDEAGNPNTSVDRLREISDREQRLSEVAGNLSESRRQAEGRPPVEEPAASQQDMNDQMRAAANEARAKRGLPPTK